MTCLTAPPLPLDLLERSAAMLRVLAHARRLQIVERLMAGRMSVGELAEALGMAPAAVSGHLGHMRAQGIVGPQRRGRVVHYRVINPNACNLIRCLRRHRGEERG
jgi:DNA-binding transcriptional ArsR family regulator